MRGFVGHGRRPRAPREGQQPSSGGSGPARTSGVHAGAREESVDALGQREAAPACPEQPRERTVRVRRGGRAGNVVCAPAERSGGWPACVRSGRSVGRGGFPPRVGGGGRRGPGLRKGREPRDEALGAAGEPSRPRSSVWTKADSRPRSRYCVGLGALAAVWVGVLIGLVLTRGLLCSPCWPGAWAAVTPVSGVQHCGPAGVRLGGLACGLGC